MSKGSSIATIEYVCFGVLYGATLPMKIVTHIANGTLEKVSEYALKKSLKASGVLAEELKNIL